MTPWSYEENLTLTIAVLFVTVLSMIGSFLIIYSYIRWEDVR